MPSQSANSEPLSVRSRPNSLAYAAGAAFLQRVEPLADCLRGLLGHRQRQLELERPGVQCEQTLPVGLEPHDGVHLAGGGAILVGQSHERGVGARLAVRRRLARLGVRPGLVAALPAQVEVAHPGVAALDPPVYGGRRGLDLSRPGQRDLLGRQPARDVGPYQAHYVFELGLVPVHAHPGFAQFGVGERLRPGRRVLAAPRPAAVVPVEPAPVAAMRPRQQLRARPCRAPRRPCRPCPALATQCGCAPPRRRPSTAIGPAPLAICLQDLRLSRPLSIAARSALSSLRYGLVAFFLMLFLSLGRAFGPRLKKESRTQPDMSG